MNTLGYALIKNPQSLKRAREMLIEAIAINPEEPAYRDSLGWAEYHLGNVQRSETYLQQAFIELPSPEVLLVI